jgi:hypothetical protein
LAREKRKWKEHLHPHTPRKTAVVTEQAQQEIPFTIRTCPLRKRKAPTAQITRTKKSNLQLTHPSSSFLPLLLTISAYLLPTSNIFIATSMHTFVCN